MLPSLNVRFGLTDDQFVRFAASRALSRADMGLYKFYYTVGVDQGDCADGTVTWTVPGDCTSVPVAWTPRYTADTGNPKLKPTTADRLDLTYEWYFSSSGSFTAAVFYKKFNDYIVKASTDEELTNNGVTRTVNVTRPVNADGAKVTGFEARVPDVLRPAAGAVEWPGCPGELHVRRQQGCEQLGPDDRVGHGGTEPGRATSRSRTCRSKASPTRPHNLVLMFEQEKFSARLAYNWRDDYLISQADCCIKLPDLAGSLRSARCVGPLQADRAAGTSSSMCRT